MSITELIVSVGILALLGIMGSSLLFGALRGSRKADAVVNVRGEGAYAMNVMTSMLRYAQALTNCSGNKVTYVARVNESPTSFACSGNFLASGSARLTSTSVTVSACSISCDTQLKRVNIRFSVSAVNAASAVETANANFDSQVVLRNKE